MNYFKILGLSNQYTDEELEKNYHGLTNLIIPYLDESSNLINTFMNIVSSYEFLKKNPGSVSLSNEDLESNKKNITIKQSMFDKLNDSFNVPVKIIYVYNGQLLATMEFIEKLVNYDKIKLYNNKEIKFVGYKEAIMKIVDFHGNELYCNPLIDGDYNVDDENKLAQMYKISFGDTIGESYYEINKINDGKHELKQKK